MYSLFGSSAVVKQKVLVWSFVALSDEWVGVGGRVQRYSWLTGRVNVI